jgi:arylsulfatase A-like enzyme
VQPPENYLERYRQRYPDVPEKRAKLAAFVEHLDASIGTVLKTLDEIGKSESTLVVFSSDNGGAEYFGSDNGPLAGGKQEMLEGGLRVPTTVVWPGHIAPGTTSDQVALTMDLFPTLCQAAGVEFDAPIDGRSFLPTLLGKPQPDEDRILFWVRLEGGKRYRGKPYYAVRHGQWKLLRNDAFEPYRLYNLKTDPGETTDVSESNPAVAADLRRALDRHIERAGRVPWRGPDGRGPGEIER